MVLFRYIVVAMTVFIASWAHTTPISQLTITSISEYSGRLTLRVDRSHSDLRHVPSGFAFVHENKIYTTTVASGVGNIYLPMHFHGAFRVGDNISIHKWPTVITGVSEYNGMTSLKTNKSTHALRSIRSGRSVIHVNNGKRYNVLSPTGVGNLYVPLASKEDFTPGQVISEIEQPQFPYRATDLLFSNRASSGFYDRLPIADDFLADHLVWHYPGDNSPWVAEYSRRVKEASCSIDTWVRKPDAEGLACEDFEGNKLVKPWVTQPSTVVNGDILKTSFKLSRFEYMKQSIFQGCSSLQQDDPDQNVFFLDYGGCMSSEGDVQFRTYLKQTLTPGELSSLGVTDHFSYRSYLKSHSDHLKTTGVTITGSKFGKWSKDNNPFHELYSNFVKIKVIDYYKELKDVARSIAGQNIPLSCNTNGVFRRSLLSQSCDFLMMEKYESRQSPDVLALESTVLKKRKTQNISTLVSRDLKQNRWFLGLEYATGNHMILPYDVYIKWGEPRLYGNPQDYRDLLEFLKAQESYFSDYPVKEIYGKQRQGKVTKVYYMGDRNETRISHDKGADFKEVSRGAKAVIAGKSYTVSTSSTVGFLYLKGDLRSKINTNHWVQSIHGDGRAVSFVQDYSHGMPTIQQAKYKGGKSPKRAVAKIRLPSDLSVINSGARLILEDLSSYELLPSDKDDQLLIKTNSSSLNFVGKRVAALINPGGEGFDLRKHKDTAPRITSIQFNSPKANQTTLKLDWARRVIPTGARLVINGTTYTTATNTTVGNVYLKGHLVEDFRRHDRLQSYHGGGVSETYLNNKLIPEPRVIAVDDGYTAVVRKKNANEGVIHMVVEKTGKTNRRIKIDTEKVFGRDVTRLTVLSEKGVSYINSNGKDGNGFRKFTIPVGGATYHILLP